MNWLHRMRLRALAIVGALTLGVIGAVSLASLPVWPVIGVALTAAALALNTLGSRLSHPTCLACGGSLQGVEPGEHGLMCSRCGAVSQVLASRRTPPAPRLPDTIDEPGLAEERQA